MKVKKQIRKGGRGKEISRIRKGKIEGESVKEEEEREKEEGKQKRA